MVRILDSGDPRGVLPVPGLRAGVDTPIPKLPLGKCQQLPLPKPVGRGVCHSPGRGSLLLRIGTWEKLDVLLGLWSAPRLFWLSSELAAATSPFQLKCHLQFGWMSLYCLLRSSPGGVGLVGTGSCHTSSG